VTRDRASCRGHGYVTDVGTRSYDRSGGEEDVIERLQMRLRFEVAKKTALRLRDR
jgi:hypothetical protein